MTEEGSEDQSGVHDFIQYINQAILLGSTTQRKLSQRRNSRFDQILQQAQQSNDVRSNREFSVKTSQSNSSNSVLKSQIDSDLMRRRVSSRTGMMSKQYYIEQFTAIFGEKQSSENSSNKALAERATEYGLADFRQATRITAPNLPLEVADLEEQKISPLLQ